MEKRKSRYLYAGIALVLLIAAVGFLHRFSADETVNFTMEICSEDGAAVSLSMDAVLENSLISPRQYSGKLTFDETEYSAYNNVHRGGLSGILDRFRERLNDVTYAIFLKTGVYGVSDRIIIEDMVYSEEKGTYLIWLHYSESGNGKGADYFGPASTTEETGEIKEAFHEYYLTGKYTR